MRIAITGATGLIGSALAESLHHAGHVPVPLERTEGNATGDAIAWKPSEGKIDSAALNGIDAVVHLAGENIASGRWTDEKKKRILESRTKGTSLLCNSLASLPSPPKVFVSASAIGYYGDRGDEVLTEDAPQGEGFLANVCKQWEDATKPVEETPIRLVKMRTGVVLASNGGALKAMLPIFRFGLGGKVGDGTQFMSWITIDDLVRAIQHLIDQPECKGVFNMTAPNPVTNREFTKTLGNVLNRPTLFPLPKFVARLLMGEMADELLLFSQRVKPHQLLQTGFAFQHATISEAMHHVLRQDKP